MSSDDKPKLPHDVIVEILQRLPVESLLRFRCVCQSWCSTIDDPCFVDLHLNSSALDASNWHKVCLDWSDADQRLCSVFSDESLALPPQLQIKIPFTRGSSYVIVGSCNGLICLAELHFIRYGWTAHLWNLFTKKNKVVRPAPGNGSWRVGFGFDASSNDYKIVKVRDDPGRVGKKEPRVLIYSLSTDSRRSLECDVAAHGEEVAANVVFFNGSLHWFLIKFIDLHYVYRSILSLDVAGEVFDGMAPPEELCGRNFVLSLEVLNGLRAVFTVPKEGVRYRESHSICSVWVTGEYGVPESWTKLYTFEACARVNCFYGFTRNSEVLMLMDDGGAVSWNPITRRFENIPLSTQCWVGTVVESLVSL